jgi:hypothetical protein
MAESIVQVAPDSSGKKLHTWNRTIGANSIEDEYVLLGENGLLTYTGLSLPFAVTSTATANSHLFQIMAGASNKVRIRRIEIHQVVVATTVAIIELRLLRLTTAGTGGTAVTNQPLDSADAASGATSMILPTVKGTEGAVVGSATPLMIQTLAASNQSPLNPIAVWDFDRPRSKPLIIPSGTTNGVAVKNINAIAGGNIMTVVIFDESSFL